MKQDTRTRLLEHRIVFGIRPDDVRVYNSTNYDDGSWAPAKAVVSVVEVLGGETLIYANLNLDTPDAEIGSIIIKADPDTFVRRGDVLDIEISRRKFHVFDKETEKSIRRRIPEENIISSTVRGGSISFAGQSFILPPAVKCPDTESAEIAMPISALTLGGGNGKATVQWTESIEGKTLYFLKADDITLFALENGEPRFAIGEEVSFDIDFTKVSIEEIGVKPLCLTNTLDGIFIKEKNKERKLYDFFMNIGEAKLVPTELMCEKLFACKGNKIFHTPLEYIFEAKDVTVTENVSGSANVLNGKVSEMLDYGHTKYAIIDVYGQKVTAAYDGNAGDSVDLHVNPEKITIKDKTIDIIIV